MMPTSLTASDHPVRHGRVGLVGGVGIFGERHQSFVPNRFSPHDEGERARVGGYALYRRTAEAVTLRAHLNQLLAAQGRTRAVLLAGDLNDAIDAATTQIV